MNLILLRMDLILLRIDLILLRIDLILLLIDLILLRIDLILLRMENDAAIYPLHFGNSKFCKSMPPSILYITLLKTPIYNIPYPRQAARDI